MSTSTHSSITTTTTTTKRNGNGRNEDNILEERLRIASYLLPEDNLEDLIQLPIAPELISRKVRAQLKQQQQQQPKQHQRQAITRSDSSGSPSEDELHAQLPHTPSPLQQQQQQPIDNQTDLVSKSNLATSLPRYKVKPNQLNITGTPSRPSTQQIPNSLNSPIRPPHFPSQSSPNTQLNPPKKVKPTQTRSSSSPRLTQRTRTLSSSNQYPNTISTSTAKSLTNNKSTSNNKHTTSSSHKQQTSATNRQVLKLRGRSLSTSSINDELLSPQDKQQQPPWTTDPSPRIYRIDPNQQQNIDSNGTSTFQPPSHDDLILPTVARQIEKQSKLQMKVNPTQNATFSSMTSNFAQWEALGPQLLIRKASLKQIETKPDPSNPPSTTPSNEIDPISPSQQDQTEDLSLKASSRGNEIDERSLARNSSTRSETSTNSVRIIGRPGGGGGGREGDLTRQGSTREDKMVGQETTKQYGATAGGGLGHRMSMSGVALDPHQISIHVRGPTEDPLLNSSHPYNDFPPPPPTPNPPNDSEPSSVCCKCLIV